MWYNSYFIRLGTKILLGLLIILLFVNVLPYFYPIVQFIEIFFSPLILGIVLYYIFRPLVRKMLDLNFPFIVAVALVFLILGTILALIATFLVPLIITSIQEVAASPTQKIEEVKEATMNVLNIFNFNLYSYAELKSVITDYLVRVQQFIFSNTYSIITTITHVAFIFGITPFCLFYLLKDDKRFYAWIINAIPTPYRAQAEKMFFHIDQTLLTFFYGQMVVALTVTLMAFIGLSIIGIENLIFLTFITFLLALIPFLGTFVAIIPPVLVGLTESYLVGAAAGIVMVIIHLTEANIITPYVMMKRFDVHPLTVILLVVASFSFLGVTGPLWITPLYVFLREVAIQLYSLINLEKVDLE